MPSLKEEIVEMQKQTIEIQDATIKGLMAEAMKVKTTPKKKSILKRIVDFFKGPSAKL